jgi:hypothetical protein
VRGGVISHQSSVISYRSSVISYQWVSGQSELRPRTGAFRGMGRGPILAQGDLWGIDLPSRAPGASYPCAELREEAFRATCYENG